MYTQNKYYGNSDDATAISGGENANVDGITPSSSETNFNANFMTNLQVTATSTNTSKDESDADKNNATWSYAPLQYWPSSASDRISFLAYAPWKSGTSLVTKEGTADDAKNDATYLDWKIDATPKNQVDIMYSSTNALNQYYYVADDAKATTGKKAYRSSNFSKAAGVTARQNMKFEHPTARIAIAVTAGILGNSKNFDPADDALKGSTLENNGSEEKELTSATKITVKKIVLCGSNSTTTGSEGYNTGAFYKEGYLNLLPKALVEDVTPTPGNRWEPKTSEGKQTFTYTNETSVSNNGNLWKGTYDAKNHTTTATSGNKVWTPTASTDEDNKTNVLQGTTKVKVSKDGEGNVTYAGTADGAETGVIPNGSVNYIGSGDNEYLFVIPNDFSKTDAGSDELYCYIEYEAKTGDKVAVPYTSYGKLTKDFQAGHSYVIYINIGGKTPDQPIDPDPDKPDSQFVPILFTVEEVTGWGDEDVINDNTTDDTDSDTEGNDGVNI